MASLERARKLNSAVQHPALPRLHNCFDTPTGKALVYEWVPGELLSHSQNPGADDRFRGLTVEEILRAIDTLFDLHLKLAGRGYIAVDLYDGCFLYDLDKQRFWMCDLDEYRPGPFVLEEDRLPGSTRFMAPEEFVRGSRIDQVTNVYSLGRAALVLLGNRQGTLESFRGSEALKNVVIKATATDRSLRYPSVSDLVTAWNAAKR